MRTLLVGLMIALLVVSTGCRPESLSLTPQIEQPGSPLPTVARPTSPLPTPTATDGPTPTPYPTPWPQDFTPSPTATPSVTPEGAPVIITDPEGHFRLQLLPGWRAYVGGTTVIINYDDTNLGGEGDFPPGALKIQMSAGELPAGQTFKQWLSDWLTYRTIEEFQGPRPTSSEPVPYQLGPYEGVTFMRIGSDYTTMEIVLPLTGNRVMVIGLSPADSPALPEGFVVHPKSWTAG